MNERVPLLGKRRGTMYRTNSDSEKMNSAIFQEMEVEKEMRRKLNDFFMSIWQKWKLRGDFPWSFCVQAFLFTAFSFQLYDFVNHQAFHSEQHFEMVSTFNKVFLKDWQPDTSVYPPSNQAGKIYTSPDFYHHVDYSIRQYAKLNSLRIGSYGYDSENGKPPPLKFCFQQYDGDIVSENVFIELGSVQEHCLLIPVHNWENIPNLDSFSFENFLKHSNYSLNFGTLIQAQLTFRLKMVFRKFMSKTDPPECYRLNLGVEFDNTKHSGLISVQLNINPTRINCNVNSENVDGDYEYLSQQFLDIAVTVLSLISIILNFVTLCKDLKLLVETSLFFKKYHGENLTSLECLDFIDFWSIIVTVGDFVILFGIYSKFQVQQLNEEITDFSRSAEILGFGYIFQIIGNFKYLSFSLKYSDVLLLTIKKSFLNILRFLVWVFALFFGYSVIGWIILSPYHVKFSSLSAASECIFSAMHGDDIIGTFTSLNTDRTFIWWFNRIYTYSFIFIYIYIILTLAGALIMDCYEILKEKFTNGEIPATRINLFLQKKDCLEFLCNDSKILPSSEDKVYFWNTLKMMKEKILTKLICQLTQHKEKPIGSTMDV